MTPHRQAIDDAITRYLYGRLRWKPFFAGYPPVLPGCYRM